MLSVGNGVITAGTAVGIQSRSSVADATTTVADTFSPGDHAAGDASVGEAEAADVAAAEVDAGADEAVGELATCADPSEGASSAEGPVDAETAIEVATSKLEAAVELAVSLAAPG